MSKIVFAVESTNIWCQYLDILAICLGASDYNVVLLDRQELSLAALPDDVRLIAALATGIANPTKLEKRSIRSVVLRDSCDRDH